MSIGERWQERVVEAIALGALYPIIRAIVDALRDTVTSGSFETSSRMILFFLDILPLIVDVGGFIAVTIMAGPFGIIGFAMEYWAVGAVFDGSETGMWVLFLGAGLIVIGDLVWEWEYLDYILNSGRGGR